jgi:hypothetical protein
MLAATKFFEFYGITAIDYSFAELGWLLDKEIFLASEDESRFWICMLNMALVQDKDSGF